MKCVNLIIALATVVAATDAAAQSASAEALFQEGRRLIKQGKLEAGCDKMAASEKLESSVGTLLNLGDCRERLGRLADAWAAFRKAEATAKRAGNDKKREQEARRRAMKLEPDLASVTVQVGPKARASSVVVKRDGDVVDPDLWGTALIVDPGSHVVVVEAPGKKPWKSEFSVGKGGKRWVVVPTLESTAPPPPPPTAAPVVVAPEPPPPAAAPPVVVERPRTRTVTITKTWSTTRQIAVGVGIAGVAAFGAGAYFGTRANDFEARSNAICPGVECSDPEGLRLNDQAQQNALNANVLFVVGGAAVTAATVMWIVGAPATETAIVPVISDRSVGATVTRRF